MDTFKPRPHLFCVSHLYLNYNLTLLQAILFDAYLCNLNIIGNSNALSDLMCSSLFSCMIYLLNNELQLDREKQHNP